jgi:type I restriction enzyme S subunit
MNRMNEEQELPQGWELVKLKQVVATDGVFIDGDWVESKDQDPEGDIRLIQLADVGDGNYRNRSNRFMTLDKATKLNCTFLQEGDVLVARMPDPLGRACIYPGDEKKAVTVVDVCIIRTGKSGVDHRWLMNTLNSSIVRASIAGLQSGSTRLRISRKNLETIEFPLPPLPEQRRIVAKLEELFSKLDAAVAAVCRTQALLKRYRQSVLHAAVTGELTRAWRETHPPAPAETGAALLQRIRAERRAQWEAAQVAKRGGQLPLGEGWKSKYAEPEEPDTSELPELPEGWTWCRLDSVAEMCLGKMLDEAKNKGTLQPYLRNVSVRWGSFDLEDLKQMRFTEEEDERYSVKKGDLVICEGGEPGRAAIWESETPIKIQKALHRVRIKSKGLLNRFLFYSLRHDALGHYLSTYFTGTGIQHFTGAALARYTFPLPPLAEQAEIVAEIERRLTVLDALGQTLTHELKRAERLRQSILHQAFTGRLVPQDATDEPAAALLARLRETAIQPKTRKTKETPAASVKEKKPRGRKPADATQIDFSFTGE